MESSGRRSYTKREKDVYQYTLSVNVNDDLTTKLVADEYISRAEQMAGLEIADGLADQAKSNKKQQYHRELNKQM